MKNLFSVLTTLCLVMFSSLALAQTQTGSGAGDPASGAAGCAACGTLFFIPVIIFVLNIALLVWVAKDAKARGLDNSVMWMILVLFTSFLGLIIYIFSRPTGALVACRSCNNKRMQASAKCPHCGNA